MHYEGSSEHDELSQYIQAEYTMYQENGVSLWKWLGGIYSVLLVEHSSLVMVSKQPFRMGTVVTGGDILLGAIVDRATWKYRISTGGCMSGKGMTTNCWSLLLGCIIDTSAQIEWYFVSSILLHLGSVSLLKVSFEVSLFLLSTLIYLHHQLKTKGYEIRDSFR